MITSDKKFIARSALILGIFGILAVTICAFFPKIAESSYFRFALTFAFLFLISLCICMQFMIYFGITELKEQNDAENFDLKDYLQIISPATTFFASQKELEELLYKTRLIENFDRKVVKQLKTINGDLLDLEEKIASNKDRQADLDYRAQYLTMLYQSTRLLQSEYDRLNEKEDTPQEQNAENENCVSWRVSMSEDVPEGY